MVDPGLYEFADSTNAIRRCVGKDFLPFFGLFCTYNYMILQELILKQTLDCN